MAFTVESIPLGRIYLDNENPRHDPIKNEPEIIKHLIEKEDVRALARHIADMGTMSPLDRLGVIPHDKVNGAYVTAEGNRRICALKLLADPDKAATEADKKYFRQLQKQFGQKLLKVEAVIFENVAHARPWVELRHEGVQGGVGTKPWDAGQKARHSAKGTGTNPNIQADLLARYAESRGILTEEQREAISITTLTRFLSNPVFRETLGLVDNRTLNINVPTDQFEKAITRFLRDALRPETEVHSRTTAKDRTAYAQSLRQGGVAPTTRTNQPMELTIDKPPTVEKPARTTKVARNNRSPDDRRYVVPSDFRIKISNKTLKRLYDELALLDAEDFPFATNYLFRSVVEQAATLYLRKSRIQPIPKELHAKILAAEKQLAQSGNVHRNQLKNMRTMASSVDSSSSADTLGHGVHGGAVPKRIELVRAWDDIEDALRAMIEAL